MPANAPSSRSESELARVIDRNIRALIERRWEEERAKPLQERVADSVTHFTGSMLFVCLHVVLIAAWIVINLGWIARVQPFDPSFVILAMVASVEAIFLSTFVLITQNRMAAAANRRADLDLQISLLAEHEVTQLINLVQKIAQKLEIEAAHDPELEELKRDVLPETVLDRIAETRDQEHQQPPA